MKKQLRYYFNYIEACNMCGSKIATHKVLGKRMNRSQGKNPRHKTGITTTIAKCSSCGLIYANPQPVPADLQDHYGVPPEDYWKEDYFKTDEQYFQKEIAQAKKLLSFKPGMKALDVGAGLGKAMIAMNKAGFDTCGLEPSRQFYERAISKMGIDPGKLKEGMIEDLEYPENTFDLITFGSVLEHVYDPSASLVKALKWLKPKGILYVEVPSADWLVSKIINLYYRLTFTDYVGNLSPMHDPYHLYEFSLESFLEHARQNGYELAFHDYFVRRTYLPESLDFILKPYMKRTNTGMELAVWLRKK